MDIKLLNQVEKESIGERQPLPETYLRLSDDEMDARIAAAKQTLGDRLVILGHHYQRDEVIKFADYIGDSLKLARAAATRHTAEFVIFCGVHFMAESADILRGPHQKIILPDLAAGCSMADMAAEDQLDVAWRELAEMGVDVSTIVPVTYINSSAAIKAFVGRHGGVVCTSTNAAAVMTWAWERKSRVFFFPDQHLGRNTAFAMGVPLDQMAEWDYRARDLDAMNARCYRPETRVILWRGFCSVHTKFTLDQVRDVRAADPTVRVLVHPECPFDVVQAADLVGSTEFIIDQVRGAAPGASWAIGTEVNLVHRLALEHPEQRIASLQKNVCPCATMNRIDPAHLLWALENLAAGHVVNPVRVPETVKRHARVALDRMLALKGSGQVGRAAMAKD